MNLLKYLIFTIVMIGINGCTNPNSLSIGKVEEKKNLAYKEEKYKEVLIEKVKNVDSEKQLKQNLYLQTQFCIKKLNQTGDTTLTEERFYRSWWVDIDEMNIVFEYNLRNFIQYKNNKEAKEEIILGGSYSGNKQLKIKLPYDIKKLNENEFSFILKNSSNIEMIESFNTIDKRNYEHARLSMTKEEYKESVLKIITCIQENYDY